MYTPPADFRPLFVNTEEMRRNWGWFLALGIALIITGIIAASAATYTTLFTVLFLGCILVIGGILKCIYSFSVNQWSGFFLSLFGGLLYLAAGCLILYRPFVSAITITLLLAMLFIVSGSFKMISSAMMRFRQWGWIFLNGLIAFLMGILILADWPLTGFWVLGLFLGIDLIFFGWAWIVIAMSAKNLKA